MAGQRRNLNPTSEDYYSDGGVAKDMANFTFDDDSDGAGRRNPRRRASIRPRQLRLFQLRKEGDSWANSYTTELNASSAEMESRAKKQKKGSTVIDQMKSMSDLRRNKINELLDRLNSNEDNSWQWELLSIENDNPEITKRTGKVKSFSVMLQKVPSMGGLSSRDGRGESFRQSFASGDRLHPQNRGENLGYHHDGRSSNEEVLDDDPFGNTPMFARDGKPMDAQGAVPFDNAGLPAHIPRDVPIGKKLSHEHEDHYHSGDGKANKKSKKKSRYHSGDDIDIDGILGDSEPIPPMMHGGRGGKGGHDDHGDHFDDEPELIDLGELDLDDDHGNHHGNDHDHKRGRKGQKFGNNNGRDFMEHPNRSQSRRGNTKSKRRPSLKLPTRFADHGSFVETQGGRRSSVYPGSNTTPSVNSDDRVFDPEYEDYSSATDDSTHGYSGHDGYDKYAPKHHGGGRSRREREGFNSMNNNNNNNNNHRRRDSSRQHHRGPPSPFESSPRTSGYQQQHYFNEHIYTPAHHGNRPSHHRRYSSMDAGAYQHQKHDGYHAYPQTPLMIHPPLAPRYRTSTRSRPHTPASGNSSPTFSHPIVVYPGHASATTIPQDTIQTDMAERYMRNIDREENVARREEEVARRERFLADVERGHGQDSATGKRYGDGIGNGSGFGRYTFEPRSSRRYTSSGY